VGHPYPNRRYTVGCRKDRRKITNGILVETGEPVQRFRATARWGINADLGFAALVHATAASLGCFAFHRL